MLRAVPLGASAFPEWWASTMLTSKSRGSALSAADIAMRRLAPTEKLEATTAGTLPVRAEFASFLCWGVSPVVPET